jgi:mono/diheme cytochrome c family protein
MAFNPKTGLVYIPTLELPFPFSADANFKYRGGQWNTGIDALVYAMPDDRAQRAAIKAMVKGDLIAWDPVAQKEMWRVKHAGPGNGGVLTTAGNLVFQGTADKRFVAYRADNGEKLWETPTNSGVVAAPISYEIDSEQYVAILAGWGGALPLISGAQTANAGANDRRLLVYKLGAHTALPASVTAAVQHPEPPPAPDDAATILKGKLLYQTNCAFCHGNTAMGNNVLPDLRWSPMLEEAAWKSIVIDGAKRETGMNSFQRFLQPAEVEAIRAYVVSEARKELATN